MDGPAATEGASDTREAIMDAVYAALCEYGYADLTMARIADELGKSTALLHYYYEGKEDLLVAFLEHLLTELDERVAAEAADPPAKLATMVDTLLPDSPTASVSVALMEMKAQTPYVPAFREQFRANDDRIVTLIEETVREGIESGHFDPNVDPATVAERLRILIEGARTRSIVFERAEPLAIGRATIEEYLASIRVDGEVE